MYSPLLMQESELITKKTDTYARGGRFTPQERHKEGSNSICSSLFVNKRASRVLLPSSHHFPNDRSIEGASHLGHWQRSRPRFLVLSARSLSVGSGPPQARPGRLQVQRAPCSCETYSPRKRQW